MKKSQSRQEACNIKKDVLACEVCGSTQSLQVHHKDRDALNNSADNLIKICYFCHAREHRGEFIPIGYIDNFKKKKNNINVSDKKTSFVLLNLLQTITKNKRSSIKVEFARHKISLHDYIDVSNYILKYIGKNKK